MRRAQRTLRGWEEKKKKLLFCTETHAASASYFFPTNYSLFFSSAFSALKRR